jgi:ATP-dependent Zn protease
MDTFWTSTLVSIAPFVLLLALWFFLLRQMRKGGSSTKKNLVDPMEEMLKAVIVPEIRALRESVESLRAEIKASNEGHDR